MRQVIKGLTRLAILYGLFCTGILPQAGPAQRQWSVVNYYVYDNMPFTSVNGLWRGVTHLAIGDVHAAADGSVNYTFDPGKYFPAAVSAAHEHGAKALVILSDTGKNDNLKSALESHRAALLNNIARVISTYGFDGIQVDWEKSFPYRSTQATLGLFFQALRAKLGNSTLIMADAFAAGGPYGQSAQTQWNTAIPYLDRLAIMTYDSTRQVSGTHSWFNSPLYNGATADSTATSIDQSIRLYLSSGSMIPASKLMIGLAFYGYTYTGVSGPRQSAGNLRGQSNYSTLFSMYDLSSAKYDTSAQVPWLPVRNGYITFDNAHSLTAKIAYAKSKELGGWMIFNLFADYLPSHYPQHPLLAAVALAIGANSAPVLKSDKEPTSNQIHLAPMRSQPR
jgi:chitinase